MAENSSAGLYKLAGDWDTFWRTLYPTAARSAAARVHTHPLERARVTDSPSAR